MEGLCPHWEGRGGAWMSCEPLPLILHGPKLSRVREVPRRAWDSPAPQCAGQAGEASVGRGGGTSASVNISVMCPVPSSCLGQPGSHWGSRSGRAGRRGAGPPGCTLVHRPQLAPQCSDMSTRGHGSGHVSPQPQLGTGHGVARLRTGQWLWCRDDSLICCSKRFPSRRGGG